jgi:hypothetical protein
MSTKLYIDLEINEVDILTDYKQLTNKWKPAEEKNQRSHVDTVGQLRQLRVKKWLSYLSLMLIISKLIAKTR